MARGAQAKARRKTEKKKARQEAAEELLAGSSGTHDFMAPVEDDDDDEEEEEMEFPTTPSTNLEGDDGVPPPKKKKTKSSSSAAAAAAVSASRGKKKTEIKTMPLVLLVILTFSTLLPALLYAGDFLGSFLQKNHVLGSLGYKLGIGPSPRKRLMSFYETHDPEKIPEVPKILSRYYGDYPKMIKKLERKYGDYGYFLNWEDDEAPMKLALEQLEATRDYLGEQFNLYAPSIVKTGARNFRNNMALIRRKGYKIWKKHIWPLLEPIVGVPKGGAAQKRKDAAEARARKASRQGGTGGRKRKNRDYRDDIEDEH